MRVVPAAPQKEVDPLVVTEGLGNTIISLNKVSLHPLVIPTVTLIESLVEKVFEQVVGDVPPFQRKLSYWLQLLTLNKNGAFAEQ